MFSCVQRHFSVFALSFPGSEALSTIYSTILTQHLKRGNFSGALQKSSQQLINLALALHLKVAATFLPTAIKFHYNFNLRDFSNVFQVSSFFHLGACLLFLWVYLSLVRCSFEMKGSNPGFNRPYFLLDLFQSIAGKW